jgi:hypothetical protein
MCLQARFFNSNHATVGQNKILGTDYIQTGLRRLLQGVSGLNLDEERMSKPISYEEFVSKTGLNLLNR